MILYAIVEDYDNGKTFEDEEWTDSVDYDNQLIGLFESKPEAFSHIRDGVLSIWHEDKVSVFGKYVIGYSFEDQRLYRRLVEIETDKMYTDVCSDSILCSRNK